MIQLKIITASTRPGRKGPLISSWIESIARKQDDLAIELLDLAEINLPFLDEPEHPRLQKYTKPHTIAWSKTIDSADAFIFVTPEYNFGFPAALKNALDFLYNEWNYKPVAFVSYGGLSGGTRSVQMLKQVVTALNMMPIAEAVNIPFFTKLIDEADNFNPGEQLIRSAEGMLAALSRWSDAMKTLREKK